MTLMTVNNHNEQGKDYRSQPRWSAGKKTDAALRPHSAPLLFECSFKRIHSQLPWKMTVREMLATLQQLPRDAEAPAFEAGCEEYCEREVDEVALQSGRVYLHLGARRDEPPQR
jgi:hypothetical protein